MFEAFSGYKNPVNASPVQKSFIYGKVEYLVQKCFVYRKVFQPTDGERTIVC